MSPNWCLCLVGLLAACGSVKNPGSQGTPDAGPDAFVPVCAADQPMSCTGGTLTSCNHAGTGQVTSMCALGCSASAPRCTDVAPSNNLGQYLDMAAGQPDLAFGFGSTAAFDTDTGAVSVDNNPVSVLHFSMLQTDGPKVEVFVVKSLTVDEAFISGASAFAVVSAGDITINTKLIAGGHAGAGGAGGYNDPTCRGKTGVSLSSGPMAIGGSGGGGFGTQGGAGGGASGAAGNAAGGVFGQPSGNAELVPLRGGCDGGAWAGDQSWFGGGGGAIQLVSRTKIWVPGIIAVNGAPGGAGGSGGGLLLEAPAVDVSGALIANGGGGGGGGAAARSSPGEAAHYSTTPALGGQPPVPSEGAAGGTGAAAGSQGGPGGSITVSGGDAVFGGFGGGGEGRIRINTLTGLHATGVFSPTATDGTLATR